MKWIALAAGAAVVGVVAAIMLVSVVDPEKMAQREAGDRRVSKAVNTVQDPDPPPPAAGPPTVNIFGEWHDRVGTQWTAQIRMTYDKTSFYVDSIFSDGSVVHRRLTQLAPRPGEIHRFLVRESSHGDGYAIKDDGDLLIFDNDGFIRKAKRIRNTED